MNIAFIRFFQSPFRRCIQRGIIKQLSLLVITLTINNFFLLPNTKVYCLHRILTLFEKDKQLLMIRHIWLQYTAIQLKLNNINNRIMTKNEVLTYVNYKSSVTKTTFFFSVKGKHYCVQCDFSNDQSMYHKLLYHIFYNFDGEISKSLVFWWMRFLQMYYIQY